MQHTAHGLGHVSSILGRAALGGLLALAPFVVLVGCEPTSAIGTRYQTLLPSPLGPNAPLDILFVVDNSGSMAEEQATLARSFFKPECPIQSLTAVPSALLNPEPGLLEELSAVCGFAQLLAAYDREFRVGVITTDVNACDNLIPDAMGGLAWGHRPQRGCLQPVPSTGQRVIERSDVEVATKFSALMESVGTYGSPVERGFDAVDAFFTGDVGNEACEGDLDLFLRDDAQLLVVFVSDEDDCSHAEGDALFGSRSEMCGEDVEWFTTISPEACYADASALAPVDDYVGRLRTLKGEGRAADVMVGFIGGMVETDAGARAAGCRPLYREDGTIVDVTSVCYQSHGLSSFTGPSGPCDPALVDEPCCTADGGERYAAMSTTLGSDDPDQPLAGSICEEDFVRTLVAILQRTERDG